jgi:hypothetical protein
MTDLKEKLVCIKFCFKLNKSAIETFNTLKVAFETKEHKFVGPFSKYKSSVTSGKIMNTKDCLKCATQMNMWAK